LHRPHASCHTPRACAAAARKGNEPLDKRELDRVQAYLRQVFQNTAIRVVPRPRKDDSAEVYIGEEFIGVLFLDDEDGDRSYNFQMAILQEDLG
jgi:hypothetical protein